MRKGRIRRNDHATSVAAAVKVDTAGYAKTIRGLVKRALSEAPGGLTDDELLPVVTELAIRTGHRAPDESSPRKRRGELVEDGVVVSLIDVDGQPMKRRNAEGNWMLVWGLVTEQPAEEVGRLF